MPLKIEPQRDRTLHRLFRDGEVIALSRGENIYEAGNRARRLFVVRDGHVRLRLPPDGRGRTRTVAVAGPLEIFGEEALVDGSRRIYDARAGERTRIAAVEGRAGFRSLQEAGGTLPLFLHAASVDLLRARWPAPGGAGPSTSERLADLLLELAERFGHKEREGTRIPHWFTHEELADLVGAHRSTVTTQLNEWIYEGILEEGSNEVVIARPAALDERSSGREAWVGGR